MFIAIKDTKVVDQTAVPPQFKTTVEVHNATLNPLTVSFSFEVRLAGVSSLHASGLVQNSTVPGHETKPYEFPWSGEYQRSYELKVIYGNLTVPGAYTSPPRLRKLLPVKPPPSPR